AECHIRGPRSVCVDGDQISAGLAVPDLEGIIGDEALPVPTKGERVQVIRVTQDWQELLAGRHIPDLEATLLLREPTHDRDPTSVRAEGHAFPEIPVIRAAERSDDLPALCIPQLHHVIRVAG